MSIALERTSRRIVAGTWGCAVIVMVASAANAALTYGALGDNRALGLATGVAVDIGLCVALIGDRQLYVHGLSSNWGRTLRITTATMSLILNTGISVRDGHYFLALMHAFLPVLLVVLTEYGQDVLLQFTALARQAEGIPLGRSGSPAERPDKVLPGTDGLSPSSSPSLPGPIDVEPVHPLSPGSGVDRRSADRVVVAGPLPVPVRPEVLVRPTGAAQTKPARKRPAHTGSGSKRAGATGRSDEQLVQAARELSARTDGPLTQYAIRQAFGLGSTRAARVLDLLEQVPAGAPGSNGQARVRESN